MKFTSPEYFSPFAHLILNSRHILAYEFMVIIMYYNKLYNVLFESKPAQENTRTVEQYFS